MGWDDVHRVRSLKVFPYITFYADDLRCALTHWPWTFALYQLSRGQTMYRIWAKSNNPRRSYCDLKSNLAAVCHLGFDRKRFFTISQHTRPHNPPACEILTIRQSVAGLHVDDLSNFTARFLRGEISSASSPTGVDRTASNSGRL